MLNEEFTQKEYEVRVEIPFSNFILEANESQGMIDHQNNTRSEWRNPFLEEQHEY